MTPIGGGSAWGSITGTLADQTDLQNALNAKLSLTGGTLTGKLCVESGSAASPSLAFGADTDTGLALIGGQISFVQNATEHLRMGFNLVSIMQPMIFLNSSNISFGTSAGNKIGTATSQKFAFWNASPVVQPSHIADPSGGAVVDAEARIAINAILAWQATLGLTAAA